MDPSPNSSRTSSPPTPPSDSSQFFRSMPQTRFRQMSANSTGHLSGESFGAGDTITTWGGTPIKHMSSHIRHASGCPDDEELLSIFDQKQKDKQDRRVISNLVGKLVKDHGLSPRLGANFIRHCITKDTFVCYGPLLMQAATPENQVEIVKSLAEAEEKDCREKRYPKQGPRYDAPMYAAPMYYPYGFPEYGYHPMDMDMRMPRPYYERTPSPFQDDYRQGDMSPEFRDFSAQWFRPDGHAEGVQSDSPPKFDQKEDVYLKDMTGSTSSSTPTTRLSMSRYRHSGSSNPSFASPRSDYEYRRMYGKGGDSLRSSDMWMPGKGTYWSRASYGLQKGSMGSFDPFEQS